MTSRDHDLRPYWAINGVHYETMDRMRRKHPRDGRLPFPFQVYAHRHGLVVTAVLIKQPLVASNDKRSKYAHFPRYAWVAWENGVPIKSQVRFLCGGYSWTAQGVSEEDNVLPVCVKCRIVKTGPEPVIACLDRIKNA